MDIWDTAGHFQLSLVRRGKIREANFSLLRIFRNRDECARSFKRPFFALCWQPLYECSALEATKGFPIRSWLHELHKVASPPPPGRSLHRRSIIKFRGLPRTLPISSLSYSSRNSGYSTRPGSAIKCSLFRKSMKILNCPFLNFQKNQSDAELRHLEVFVRWADVLVLVYSVTDRASFSLALQLLEQVKEFASFIFIGKSLTSSSSSSHFRHPPISAPDTPDPPEPPPAAAAAAAAPAAGPQPRKEP